MSSGFGTGMCCDVLCRISCRRTSGYDGKRTTTASCSSDVLNFLVMELTASLKASRGRLPVSRTEWRMSRSISRASISLWGNGSHLSSWSSSGCFFPKTLPSTTLTDLHLPNLLQPQQLNSCALVFMNLYEKPNFLSLLKTSSCCFNVLVLMKRASPKSIFSSIGVRLESKW